ncbi:MAG: bifunctional phosphopantothenoylcysteine decarboxylase/phosphopantothenate--cysteine ligase CoaBC [Candidatus Gastranaerophilaceae bacterium]
MQLEGKTILIGITAGIAAYKICELIRMYKRGGANVRVVVTPNTLNFVTKLTLETLSQNEVFVDNFEEKEYKPEHISLCDEADVMVIAPATANTISKIANGICDNLLTSTVCAFNKPIIVAPAMNTNMWNNSIIQDNLQKLEINRFNILNPESGFLACGTTGNGRLCSLEKIFDKTIEVISQNKKLSGKRILITAGGTKEKIDPVRYISNFSSGKMGTALADVAYSMGADVVLVSTFDIVKPYKVIKIESAIEMQKVVMDNSADCIIMTAAVGDYRVKEYSEQKIKKATDTNELQLTLIKNPDILQEISEKKDAIIVGFCAESENLIENAKMKIKNKGCDYLIANDISRKDIGFSSNENEVYIMDSCMNIEHIEKDSKQNIAHKILEKVFG